MRSFVILAFFTFLLSFQAHAKSEVEILNTSVQAVIARLPKMDADVATRKKDTLNTKINARLKGEVNLFMVVDKIKVC
ncbi:MAG: hypothetical protein ABI295_07725 [Xanthomarina sp.]